jgi:hypothetical protein
MPGNVLLNSLGMQFRDQDSRMRYFQQAEQNPERVPFGASLAHAYGTHSGALMSETELRRDCARIMALEVTKFARSLGHTIAENIPMEDIVYTRAFTRAFDHARGDNAPLRACLSEVSKGDFELKADVSSARFPAEW